MKIAIFNDNKTIVTMTNEIDNPKVIELNPSELSQIISNQVRKMTELEKKINEVMEKAENAKKAASNKKKITFISGSKEAIEELQSSKKSLASAIQTNAEALKLSFDFQKEFADISKFLIKLGVSNIFQNRIVVRELELKLKGASNKELSDLARKELLSIVRQLKAQEDLFQKQEHINKKIKELNKQIDFVSENNENLVENIISIEETDKRQDDELTKQFETDKRHDEELAKQKAIDKQHDLKILQLEEKAVKYEKELKEIKTINENQFVEINKLKEILKQYEQNISFLTNQKNRLNSKLNIVIIIFSVVTLLLSLITYFIH